MLPESPVIPGQNFNEVIVAEDQPEYQNLPVIFLEGNVILCRWHMSQQEQIVVSETGVVYLWLWTFGAEPPLVQLQINCPALVDSENDSNGNGNDGTSASAAGGVMYSTANLPVLGSPEGTVLFLIELTDEDKRLIASTGDIYVFMHTKGKPITPMLLDVLQANIEFAENPGFLTAPRYSEEIEQTAAANDIKTVRGNCSECGADVIFSEVSRDAINSRSLKIICKVCADASGLQSCVMPETVAELEKVVENRKPNQG